MSKYHSRKTVIDGITFDSIKEANRYAELKWMQKAGVISGLTLQPKYTLQEAFEINGKRRRAITYIADFAYVDDGKMVVEDVKGVKTEAYKIKKKLFEKKYNTEITEI